ncbi:hypothetical protein A4X09_0g1104 [Tilletia walkeri]|uniref:Alpha-methylacyl-CoA racemase n=1 Tax=Tilletia walkeri TaxID=117179 RepID=A0A8X7T7C2_9BASI|nr:hypothetical protein A4X09_0g1104 [Tilletia walkeri]
MATSFNPLPLAGVRVIEFAGQATTPMVGVVLADWGADVVRIDRVEDGTTFDLLCRGKRSVAINGKHAKGRQVIKDLVRNADVLLDPFRPGVLEKLGLGPQDLMEGPQGNKGLVYARQTGFQRTGPYANMAGHEINFIALSGVLSMLGRQGGPPEAPMNILGSFAGGSFICVIGILLALFERTRSGLGQVVNTDAVTGTRYLSTFNLLSSYISHPAGGTIFNDGTNRTRGTGLLAGEAPWYGVYRCQDGGWFSVGAIEPQFYRELLAKLRTVPSAPESPHPRPQDQLKRSLWPDLRAYLTATFASRPRSFFESLFTGSDACAVPVLTRDEAAVRGSSPFADPDEVGVPADSSSSSQTEPGSGAQNIVIPAVAPNLTRTPARIPHGSPGRGEEDRGAEMTIQAGEHTLEVIKEWKILGEGEGADRLKALWMEGVVGGPETPEGWEPARIMAKL